MISSEQAEFSSQIERYLRSPPLALRFPPALEARFQQERTQACLNSYHFGSLFIVISFNLSIAVMIAWGVVAADRAFAIYLADSLLLTVPVLAMLILVQLHPDASRQVDRFSLVNCAVATLTLIAINRILSGDIAIYEAFSLVLLPFSFNILASISFWAGVALAGLYLPALIANALTTASFPATSTFFMLLMYSFAAALSLLALHRIEAAERKNYLNYLRENVRNAEITEANRQLSLLSRTDPLTGLSNRRDFDARFATEHARARAENLPLAALVLDIDHFKLYNDKLGHPEGDACIRAVARAVAEAAGEAPNIAGRIGGEEFAIVLPGYEVEEAAAMAARVRAGVAALRIPHPALGDRRIVSVSLGAACLNPACPETAQALLARADAALYRAKRAGRDRAEFDLKVVGG